MTGPGLHQDNAAVIQVGHDPCCQYNFEEVKEEQKLDNERERLRWECLELASNDATGFRFYQSNNDGNYSSLEPNTNPSGKTADCDEFNKGDPAGAKIDKDTDDNVHHHADDDNGDGTAYGIEDNFKDDDGNDKNMCFPGSDKATSEPESCCQKMVSCRWKLAYLCFLVRFITGAFRQCMSISILSMVKENNVSTSVFKGNLSQPVTVTKMEREFEWSTTFQGLVLTTFNVGAIMAPLLVGCLTRKTSERTIILLCLLIGGASSFLLPPLVVANDYTIFLTRGAMGLSLAGTDNVIQSLWSCWAPAKERASLSSFAYAGISVAGIVTYPICGLIISLGDHESGWPNIYYAFGTFTMLLVPLWWFNAFDNPKQHPRIGDNELGFITDDLIQYDKESDEDLPWKYFLTSPALWAIFVCYLGNKLVFSLLLSFLPFYFHENLQRTLEESSVLSALPHIGRFVSGVVGGYLSDWMLSKGFSIVVTRKTFQTLACFGCAVCAVVLIFIDHKNAVLSVTILVVSVSFQNVASVAYRINLLDIAPRYVGFLSGLIGTATNILSMPGPVITSVLLQSDSDSGWPMVFITVAGVNTVAGLVFLFFAAGEVQPWATPDYKPLQ